MRSKQLLISAGLTLGLASAFFGAHLLLAAQPSTQSSVYLSPPIVSTSTSLVFAFKTGINLPAGSSIVLTMNPAFSLPPSVTPADGYVTVNGVDQTLGASPASGVFGYSKVTSTYRMSFPTDANIGSGTDLVVQLGRELGIISPSATGSYPIIAKFYDDTNQYLGGVQVIAVIARPLAVSANVNGGDLHIRVTRIKPEKRVGTPGTNDAAPYFINLRYGNTFYNSGGGTTANPRGTVIYSQPNLSQANSNGTDGSTITLSGLFDTGYDIGIKTDQHLTRILRDVLLTDATTTDLNFTDPNNGPADAGQVLLGGDINGAGTSPGTFGDDVVNSVDLSILIQGIDAPDLTHSVYRSNLNKDDVVNSVDLSIMLKNLDVEGDR